MSGAAQVDPARATLRRFGWSVAALTVAVVVAAVTLGLFRRADGGGGVVAGGGAGQGPVTVIGPTRGADLVAYAADRAAALDEAEGSRVAVASLTSYRRASAAGRVLQGVAADVGSPVTVIAWLVALPGGPPESAGTDLAAWAAAATQRAVEERAAIEALLPTVEPTSPFAAFYQRELVRLEALAAGVDPDGEVVFAVVVQASAAALRTLAAEGEVRLVDVGPSAELAVGAELCGLRPEELERAGDPPIRPA